MPTIRIATRKSPLAVWQAEHVAQALRRLDPTLEVELVGMVTQGDRILDSPLAKVGGKGLFVKELEQGMLDGRADIAVHSMKDVPMAFPAGLTLGAILPREDPRDAFVALRYDRLDDLPAGAVVGTSSLRRAAQIRARFPDLQVEDLRGNVNTRLRKLDEGHYEAIILAAAGLKRLGLAERIRHLMDPDESLPAIGQGAIGIECRDEPGALRDLLARLHDPDTGACVRAERAMNQALNGGCQVPIAGHAVLDERGEILLRGLVAEPNGSVMLRCEVSGPAADAEDLGRSAAAALLAQGAGEILTRLGLGVPD